MKESIKSLIEFTDRVLSRIYLRFFEEKNSLITFLFHGLFRNEKEISFNLVDPQQRVTVEHLRLFIEYYLNHGYTFVSTDDILKGLHSNRKYILITFDDGYYNNQYALPVLQEYQVPAIFFISSGHVKHNKCFWWDVLYRERTKHSVPLKSIRLERRALKSKRSEQVEKYLVETFGERALRPTSDIDRPFSPSELKDFSREEYVYLGNHTSEHAILTNYSPDEVRTFISDAQSDIYDITGITPTTISYPNGDYSNGIVRAASQIGLKLGITVDPVKNYLPIDFEGNAGMQLGRFILYGNDKLMQQCEILRSEILLAGRVGRLLKGVGVVR